jgi:hypothetical protein
LPSDPALWNNPITRRRFLRRSGGATAGVVLANAVVLEVLANTSNHSLTASITHTWRDPRPNNSCDIQFKVSWANAISGDQITIKWKVDGCTAWSPSTTTLGQPSGTLGPVGQVLGANDGNLTIQVWHFTKKLAETTIAKITTGGNDANNNDSPDPDEWAQQP